MKRSHFVTPRSLGECTFDPTCDPFEGHLRATPRVSFWSLAITMILATAAIAAIVAGALT